MAKEGSIPRIPPPDEVRPGEKERVQPYLDPYTYRVISRLVGVRGLDQQEVVRQLLREWIHEHRAELDEMGIQPPKVRDNGIVVNHEE